MPRDVLVIMDKRAPDDPAADLAPEPDPEQLGELPAGQAQQDKILKRNPWPRVIVAAVLAVIAIVLVIWHVLRMPA